MSTKVLLTDLELPQSHFEAGDRILVRASHNLTWNQEQSLIKSIIKFAKTDVRVLIINCLDVKLMIKKLDGSIRRLADASYAQTQKEGMGVANISCSKVDFEDGDQLLWDEARFREAGLSTRNAVYYYLEKRLEKWAGDDVEIVITKGIYT